MEEATEGALWKFPKLEAIVDCIKSKLHLEMIGKIVCGDEEKRESR